ncbi:MAG: trypsin-like peptidase domain-containing protein [Myxococcaceae bacterium]
MFRLLPLLLVAVTALAHPTTGPAARPTSASLRKAFEANEAHLVSVSRGKKKHGPGVLVSSTGHVVTSTEYVNLDAAVLQFGAEQVPGEVVFADARLKIAVVKPLSGTFSACAVQLQKPVATGDWLLAISPAKKDGAAEPKVGQVLRTDKPPFIETDLYLPAGTPLFDPKSRELVAVLVTAKGRALPMPFIKAKLEENQKLTASGTPP